MLNTLILASRLIQRSIIPQSIAPLRNLTSRLVVNHVNVRNLSLNYRYTSKESLLTHPQIQQISYNITRNLTKYSYRTGKRKSVKAVLRRFYRLDWGGWIRCKAGRKKKLWKKTSSRKRRLRQHVFCNATQSYLLDKMVGPYWRKPKYYVDDPYAPYHVREEYELARKTPKPYIPTEH